MTKEAHETKHPATRDGIDKLESLELGETESLLETKGNMKPDRAGKAGKAGKRGGGVPQQTLMAGACFCLASVA